LLGCRRVRWRITARTYEVASRADIASVVRAEAGDWPVVDGVPEGLPEGLPDGVPEGVPAGGAVPTNMRWILPAAWWNTDEASVHVARTCQ
jgi:hypothetical protein